MLNGRDGLAAVFAPRRTMNWSEAVANVCTHGGADFGSAARRFCDRAMSVASTSPPAGGSQFSAVAVKNTVCPAVRSAVNVPGPHKSSSASSPLPNSSRCKKFQYQMSAAVYSPELMRSR